MRLLWSLPKAAPALLRHLAAYVDLAGLDLAKAQGEIAAQLLAFTVIAVCALFAVFMGCLLVVALTWDTPYRVAAIAWMGGGFLFIAVVAAAYRAKVARTRTQLFASVRREWQQDSVLLERILSSSDQE
jgi:uncharacterized membrane protein YqjE